MKLPRAATWAASFVTMSRRRKLCLAAFAGNTLGAVFLNNVPFSDFRMFANQTAIEMQSVSFRVDGRPVDIYDYTDFAMTVPPYTLEFDRSLAASGGDGGRNLREMDAFIREHPARTPPTAGAPVAEIILMHSRWDDSFQHLNVTKRVFCRGTVRKAE